MYFFSQFIIIAVPILYKIPASLNPTFHGVALRVELVQVKPLEQCQAQGKTTQWMLYSTQNQRKGNGTSGRGKRVKHKQQS